MRLSQQQIQLITTLSKRYFSDDVEVFLFGSRTEVSKKGGDIDLFIHSSDEASYNLLNKIRYLIGLKRVLGDRKIDVVFDDERTRSKEAFYRSIVDKCVKLQG